MLKYVNLGSQSAVEENFASIWSAISAESAEASTYAMPITRGHVGRQTPRAAALDLPGRNNYDVPDFNVNSIPAGWSPS